MYLTNAQKIDGQTASQTKINDIPFSIFVSIVCSFSFNRKNNN